MKVQFKQAVCINGRDYKLGVHEIPKELLATKHFHKLILSGYVTEAEPVKISADTPEQIQKKFVDSIYSGKVSPKVVMKAEQFREEDFKPLLVPIMDDTVTEELVPTQKQKISKNKK